MKVTKNLSRDLVHIRPNVLEMKVSKMILGLHKEKTNELSFKEKIKYYLTNNEFREDFGRYSKDFFRAIWYDYIKN